MRYLSADWIYPISTSPIQEHALVVSEGGVIEDIIPVADVDQALVEHFTGALCPGFVNAHCHLELSHLRKVFPEKTGLPGFLSLVVQHRNADEDFIQQCIIDADKEMWENGIVAVGDISNNASTYATKSRSKILYHTFVELLGFDPARAPQHLENGKQLLAKARAYNIRASLVPHAPYSINEALVKGIVQQCAVDGLPTSIHMLESNDENELYVQATGLYRKFYRELGIGIDSFFTPTGKTSLESVLPWFDPQVKTLLVHNTIANAYDADWAEDLHQNLYWCFCPNANLYIEDRLPDIPLLMQRVQYITLGTDSLASNHQLSILEEINAIRKQFPEMRMADLYRWATLYGARFLGIDAQFGSFEKGKTPGILVISGGEEGSGTTDLSVSRLF